MTRGVVLAACCVIAGCGESSERVVVFAAASTADVVEEVLGPDVVLSVGATSTLARQIDHGAPADLLVAADREWVDWLRERQAGRVEHVIEVATGEMVVVGPLDAEAGSVGGLEDGTLRLAIADPTHVPAGRYARRALESVGLWEDVSVRAIHTGDVRAALAAVETGAVNRAIVYASDAQASSRVRVLHRFGPTAAVPRFVVAVLDTERGLEVARTLASSPAWSEAGFGPVR
jgi:molybdate transport system substrate-binding protein